MSKPKPVMRAYPLTHHANPGKVDRVAALLPEFQRAAKLTQAWQYQRLLRGDGLWNRADPKHVATLLSERYKRSVLNQVVGGLSSWVEITKGEFRAIVSKSSLPADVKRDLYRINVRAAWYAPTLELPELAVGDDGKERKTGRTLPVPTDTLKFARRIVKHVKRHRNHLPNLARCRTMMLDGPVARFETGKTNTFNYWVRVSTLEKNKPVWIPFASNGFAENASGEWANLTQVHVSRSGDVSFHQIKKHDPAVLLTVPADGSQSLGLDFGLSTLFASTAGDLIGRGLYPWLLKIDAQLDALARNLQRQGIKPSTSKRYHRFQNRIREHVRNEINRCLNRLVELHNPSEIVVESLDFRFGGLSRRLNRIFSRVGRATVKQKLASLHETLGIRVTVVPAAHTSRECSGCGYVSKTNRKTQARFVCGFCGKKRNADSNASHVVRARRSWPVETCYASRANLLRHLDSVFEDRWGIHPDVVRTRNRRGAARSMSTPPTVGLTRSLHVDLRVDLHSVELTLVE